MKGTVKHMSDENETKTETKPMNIFQRMNAVMADVTGVDKEKYNKPNNYKYQGHDAITAALRGAYVKHGIVRTATVATYERMQGGHLCLGVDVSWINIDDPSDRFTVRSYGESPRQTQNGDPTGVQTGIALSYAVKIAELKAFSLKGDSTPDAEDGDGDRNAEPTWPQPTQATPKSPQADPGEVARAAAVEAQARVGSVDPAISNEQSQLIRELRGKLGMPGTEGVESFVKWLGGEEVILSGKRAKQSEFVVNPRDFGKPGGAKLADRVIGKLQAMRTEQLSERGDQ